MPDDTQIPRDAAVPEERAVPDQGADEPVDLDKLKNKLGLLEAQLEESFKRSRDTNERLKDTHERLLRTAAEFDNFKKRATKEKDDAAKFGNERLLKDFLPVMDNLERALDALTGQDAGVVAGLDMVRQQLGGLLSARGVTEIEAAALPFDPTVHEAVASTPTPDEAEGTVLAVVQKGYRLHDAVLRPARVVVAAAPAG